MFYSSDYSLASPFLSDPLRELCNVSQPLHRQEAEASLEDQYCPWELFSKKLNFLSPVSSLPKPLPILKLQ